MKRTIFYYKNSDVPKPNKPNHVGTCIVIVSNNEILLDHREDCDAWGLIGGALETFAISYSFENNKFGNFFNKSKIFSCKTEFFFV